MNPSPFSPGFRPMVQLGGFPRRNMRRSSVSSSPPSRALRVNLPLRQQPRGDKHLHVHCRCHAQIVMPRHPQVLCPMGTRATTSSLSFGECRPICRPPTRILTGKKVDWVFVDERRGTWELYFLRVCTCLCRGSPWNCKWHRGRPGHTRCPNLRLVCFDRQLFLCPPPTEGTLREGERAEAPHHMTNLTGVSGRVSGDLHLHPGCRNRRVLGQHFRYTFRP